MRQLLLDLIPYLTPTLDNFVVGDNAQALAALQRWLAPQDGERFVFFWGETGSGKSHLLKASGALYLDGGATPSLDGLPADGSVDRVAVDRVGRIDDVGQKRLFNFFNAIKAGGGRLLLADRQSPAGLVSILREDLRTRLGSALIYRLLPLSETDKWNALGARAEARAISLPDGAFTYLFERAPRDMRSLCALIDALDRHSLTQKKPITMALLREVMRQPFGDAE